ncbi:MAG TPA: HPr family phosphocarrier protein [Deltaproteobacteria bacterium]|nr:HPr family phosphocarrier protein [Deltaproteobacteria bacterium]
MKEKRVIIRNTLGLHARSAALFSKRASEFSSRIEVIKDHMIVNGKSIMDLLTLAAAKGCRICIRADGDDEDRAVKTLATLVRKGFGET